eukprot:Sspe_Gene.18808::Locus_6794_Transcript_2_3_Confidence_0.429_Length_799::g.18808::m.18808
MPRAMHQTPTAPCWEELYRHQPFLVGLTELCRNGLRSMRCGGEKAGYLRVAVRENDEGDMVVCVEDSGPGLVVQKVALLVGCPGRGEFAAGEGNGLKSLLQHLHRTSPDTMLFVSAHNDAGKWFRCGVSWDASEGRGMVAVLQAHDIPASCFEATLRITCAAELGMAKDFMRRMQGCNPGVTITCTIESLKYGCYDLPPYDEHEMWEEVVAGRVRCRARVAGPGDPLSDWEWKAPRGKEGSTKLT